jgi:hypothetical protein
MMKKIDKFLGGVGLLIAQAGFAHGPQPMPLIDVPIPHVQGSIQEKMLIFYLLMALTPS